MLEKKEILERLRRVQLLILDEDGVLTDGSINIGPDGKEVFKKFDVKDGHALKHQVHDFDVRTAIITGRTSSIVENHACELECAFLQDLLANGIFFRHRVSPGGLQHLQVVPSERKDQ